MGTLEIIRLLDYVINLATKVGINIARYNAMRDENGGSLSDEQVVELATEADEARGRL